MVLGEDERLTPEVKDDFQASGLAHILAVSGQNVMLLAILVLAACALLGVPLRARLMLAAAVIVLYVPLTGAGPSIQRAGVMGVAGLFAALAGRPSRRWYALLLAAALTLILNPRAAGEPGWQLSFAAVAALLAGAPPLRAALERRMPGPVAEAAAITIAATIGTAPLMALHFGEVSLASLPANLLAAPAIAPVMWLGVLAAAAAQVAEPLAAPFSALTGPLLVYLQAVARHDRADAALRRPGERVARPRSPPPVQRSRSSGQRSSPRTGVGSAPRLRAATPARRRTRGLVAALGGRRGGRCSRSPAGSRDDTLPAPPAGEVRVSFLDIGQGDATLIELDGTTVLVDTGPPDGPILDRLEEAGRRAAGRADADPRRGGPRGRRPGGDRAPPAAPDRRRRRRLGLDRSSACSRPPRREAARGG